MNASKTLVEPDTVLWFGKHKGERFKDIDLDYRNWMFDSGFNLSNEALDYVLDLEDRFNAPGRMWEGVIGMDYEGGEW